MKKIMLLLGLCFFLTGCNSTDKPEKNGNKSQSRSPEGGYRGNIEQALFYENGDYKPVMITLNETSQTVERGPSYLYFIKMELGKDGVHLTYIYTDNRAGENINIMKALTKEEYKNIMKKVLASNILDKTAYETEDPLESQMMQDHNVFEFNLEFNVLRFYYTAEDLDSQNFKGNKKIIGLIKEISSYIAP